MKNGEKLTGKHINAAQRLLHAQFPTLEGLELTLVVPHRKLRLNGIQAFFVCSNHWIVLSTIDCCPGQVNTFDSLYTSQDDGTLTAIAHAEESPGSSVTVRLMDILELQEGGNDCGLFTVAMLTALAHGIDVLQVQFFQNEMRKHFTECLKTQKMVPFSTSARSRKSTSPNLIIKSLTL